MPLLFWIPRCKQRESLKSKVERHGGLVMPVVESGVIQIKPSNVDISEFYEGTIVTYQFVHECIKLKKLISYLPYKVSVP